MARSSASVAVLYDTLVVIGTAPEKSISHVIEFDTAADTWSTLAPLPRKLTQPVHFGT